MTTAAWLRAFVQNHPLYKQDSVVSEEVTQLTVSKLCCDISSHEILNEIIKKNSRFFLISVQLCFIMWLYNVTM